MKKLLGALVFVLVCTFGALNAKAGIESTCNNDAQTMGGVDVWPWSMAVPFPWDNIQGFWKLGEEEDTYVRARVISSTSNRKILSLQIYTEGVCAKPSSKGMGYVDASEKNAVRAILSDSDYKYQLKLGLFNSRDVTVNADLRCDKVMAASMQIIGNSRYTISAKSKLMEPKASQTLNMILTKVSVDLSGCK